MPPEQNKAVVRRFISELVVGANWGAADELVAPNYVNTLMPGLDLAGFKAAVMGLTSVIQETRVDNLTLIAEGDEVVARFNYGVTLSNGKNLSARNLSCFRLDNGRIVENEPMSAPDLFQEIFALMAPPAGSWLGLAAESSRRKLAANRCNSATGLALGSRCQRRPAARRRAADPRRRRVAAGPL